MAWLSPVTAQFALTPTHSLYNRGTQEAYLCQKDGKAVIATCTRYPSNAQSKLITERLMKTREIRHPRLLEYVGHVEWEQECVVVAGEYEEKTLWRDIEQRKIANQPYSEDYLLRELKEVVDLMADLQSLGLAHTAISPYTLYVTSENSLKLSICHLYSSVIPIPDVYLPPAKRLSQTSTFHNPHKSDVYALGCAFLSMCLLREPALHSISTLQVDIDTELALISSYPALQPVLRSMLSVNDWSRLDFKGMSRQGVVVNGCLQCGKEVEGPLRLWCTMVHGFCQMKCAERYILERTNSFAQDLSTVTCSRCRAPLDPVNLTECVGGPANLSQIRAIALSPQPVCGVCKRVEVPAFPLNCGCYYCANDLNTALCYFHRRNTCVLCEKNMDKEEIRNLVYAARNKTTK